MTCAPPPLFNTDPQLAGTPAYSDFENNVIKGSLTITGLQSCWFGALRNHIVGSFIYNGNSFADPDANENLDSTRRQHHLCGQLARRPVRRLGWMPNVVSGAAIGQCAYPISVRP